MIEIHCFVTNRREDAAEGRVIEIKPYEMGQQFVMPVPIDAPKLELNGLTAESSLPLTLIV